MSGPSFPTRNWGNWEVEQPPETSSMNWDVLHAELLERAQQIGAHAIINIQTKGTIRQKILTAMVLKYLSPQEILGHSGSQQIRRRRESVQRSAKGTT